MGSDHDAFIRSIAQHPMEDFSSLVYADWLEDHDNPGAAHIVRSHVNYLHRGPLTYDHTGMYGNSVPSASSLRDYLTAKKPVVYLRRYGSNPGNPPTTIYLMSLWLPHPDSTKSYVYTTSANRHEALEYLASMPDFAEADDYHQRLSDGDYSTDHY